VSLPRLLRVVAVACGLLGAAGAAAQPVNAGPYVPTPWVILEEMLKLAAVRPDDVVFDLGSGDGRLPIEAVRRYGARAGVGVEIDEKLVALATENAAQAGVGDRVRFVRGDLFQTDLSTATLVTVYLLPNTVTQLVPKMLAEMKPGARIVAHDYPLVPWRHDRSASFEFEEKVAISGSARTVLYLYTVPARVAGAWTVSLPAGSGPRTVRLDLRQDAGAVSGNATVAGRSRPLSAFIVQGESVEITIPGLGRAGAPLVLEGRVAGDTMQGTVHQDAGAPLRWTARREPAA
jgi:16S rRNA G966 N2-methylase RsmD